MCFRNLSSFRPWFEGVKRLLLGFEHKRKKMAASFTIFFWSPLKADLVVGFLGKPMERVTAPPQSHDLLVPSFIQISSFVFDTFCCCRRKNKPNLRSILVLWTGTFFKNSAKQQYTMTRFSLEKKFSKTFAQWKFASHGVLFVLAMKFLFDVPEKTPLVFQNKLVRVLFVFYFCCFWLAM